MQTKRGSAFRRLVPVAAVVLVTVPALAARAGVPALTSPGGPVRGLPAGAAAAALIGEPKLPVPAGWSFPDSFPRTAGTGRLAGGAFEWTDWVYDAWGPVGSGPGSNSDLSQARGSYVYPSGPADADGADIFRAGVALTPASTVWRVDWNTLADPSIPIAEWTFDTDNNPATGSSAWPASAKVSSPGIENALVVSAKGAWLIDAVSGATVGQFPTTVDSNARSFVVSVPRTVLPVSGAWRIRLAAGLSDAAGTGFALPDQSGGQAASASQPRVYNITFRTAAQEPGTYPAGQVAGVAAQAQSALQGAPAAGAYGVVGPLNELTGNTWGAGDQAATLAGGDVSKFSELIRWSQLASGATTPEPLVHGWSTRWYVSDLDMGQGIDTASQAQPELLGRIQPYAVYVPTSYDGRRPAPLTWLLHGSMQAYTWAETGQPRLSAEACESRKSICASPEGLGGTGYYIGQAEHDFWQVWRQVALGFDVASDRTVITGYSMGGVGAFVLAGTYPSVFSESMPLDGSFDDGCTPVPAALASAGVSPLEAEGASYFTMPAAANRAANVHWVPMVVSSAYADELSLYPHILADTERYVAAGDRFTLFSTTGGEHVITEAEDGFSAQVAALHGTPPATSDPGTIDYTWCPEVVNRRLGLGPTAVYWLSGLSERVTSTGGPTVTTSHVVGDDHAIAEPAESENVTPSVVVSADAPPMQVLTGSWTRGATPPATVALDLPLTNVATVAVDTAAARLPHGAAQVSTDGPVALTLLHLRPGSRVLVGGQVILVGNAGWVTIHLPGGTSSITW